MKSVSHTELVDAFPVLQGMREGFFQTAGMEAARIVNASAFASEAITRGHGAETCAWFILSLCGFNQISLAHVNLERMIARLDSTHRRAASALFFECMERGVQ